MGVVLCSCVEFDVASQTPFFDVRLCLEDVVVEGGLVGKTAAAHQTSEETLSPVHGCVNGDLSRHRASAAVRLGNPKLEALLAK